MYNIYKIKYIHNLDVQNQVVPAHCNDIFTFPYSWGRQVSGFLELGGISTLCSSVFSSIHVCLLPLYLRKEYFNEVYLPVQ